MSAFVAHPIVFDPARHEYSISGKVLPGVTGVLTAVGWIDTTRYTAAGRVRGHYVHAMLAAYEQGDLDEALVPGEYLGYLESWKRTRPTLSVKQVLGVEEIRGSIAHGYCGTIDLRFASDRQAQPVVLDFKTGDPEFWHPVQLAAYSQLCDRPHSLLNVYLDSQGKVASCEFHKKLAEHVGRWQACMTVYWGQKRRTT